VGVQRKGVSGCGKFRERCGERGGGSMGVAVEKMGRYAVNCKKTAACKSRKRSATGRERTLKPNLVVDEMNDA
jgi:hypothetical protein